MRLEAKPEAVTVKPAGKKGSVKGEEEDEKDHKQMKPYSVEIAQVSSTSSQSHISRVQLAARKPIILSCSR